MSSGVSRRALLRGVALAGGAVTLGGLSALTLPPQAVAQTGVLPRLGHLSRGYPAALDTGRSMVVFGLGPEKRAYHQWQDTGAPDWEAWRIVPGSPVLKARPIPLLNANGALSLFVTDANGEIWTGWQGTPGNPAWNWRNLGKPGPAFVEEPFPVLNTNNAMSLFARADDGFIYHSYQDGPGGNWTGWQAFPYGSVGRPWAVIGPTGGMVVFARGTDGGVVHRYQSAWGTPFSEGWSVIPGRNLVNEDVSAVVGPTGAITVFAGSEDGVAYTWQKAAADVWRGEWNVFPERKILGRPSVSVGAFGGMVLFAKQAGPTANNRLIHRSQPSWGQNWHDWVELDQSMVTTGEPSGVLGRDGRLSAFWRNEQEKMVHRMQYRPGEGWLARREFENVRLEVG
ncbi:twin-arginine translocation signal domain-containing protein [Lentzea sp. NBRC 102530]|uniref:twin-arginine translocation signal domain-containing protein n=1 Tax=Lentzea sp. NBRC 102530 TaxID=3032201 RepID=UPI0024A33F55|nr:twin-arginine translocation signal domain-containing protein [Lentzea sp. NBRC 102530]GLY51452.1 hypothetical protein Lesp01_51080 [Lentzea sp. NBRC 102530]